MNVAKYREGLVKSLSSARELASQGIHQAQRKYKNHFDKKAAQRDYRVEDWLLVKFPSDEAGHIWKLARPWHGPYHVVRVSEPDVTVEKVYHLQDVPVQVHLT